MMKGGEPVISITEITFNNDDFKIDTKYKLKEKSKSNHFANVLSDKLNNNEIKDDIENKQVVSLERYNENKEKKKDEINFRSKDIESNDIQQSKTVFKEDEETEDSKFLNERINMSFMIENIEKIIAEINRILSTNENIKLDNDLKNLLTKLENIKGQNSFSLKSDKTILNLASQIEFLLETYKENKKDIKMSHKIKELLNKLNNFTDELFNESSKNKGSNEKKIIENIQNEYYKQHMKTDLLEDEIQENSFVSDKDERVLLINNQLNNLVEKFNNVKANIFNSYGNNLTNEKTLLQDIDKNMLIEQIIEKLNFNNKKTNPEVRIKLKPEILGNLLLKITTKENLVLARIIVESYQVKQVIEANLDILKDNLKEQGLEIYEFNIDVGQSTNFDNYNSQSGYNRNYFMNQKVTKLINKETEEEFLYNNEILTNFLDSSIDLKA